MKVTPADLEHGEIYKGRITRLSNTGNAIIALWKGFINLGEPEGNNVVGTTVKFRKKAGENGEVLNGDVEGDATHVNRVEAKRKNVDRTSQTTTHLSPKAIGDNYSRTENGLLSNYHNDA
jgi:hypothetical protein